MESQKKMYIGVAVLLLVVLGVIVFSNMRTPQTGSIAGLSIGNQKEEILRRVDNGEIVTEEDKQYLVEVLHGEKFKEYGFTVEEQQRIINALNK